MLEFTHIGDVTSDEVDRMRAVYQPLAESVRELVDATIRTEVDADEVAAIKAEIDAATDAAAGTSKSTARSGCGTPPAGTGWHGETRSSESGTRSHRRW